MSDEGMKGHLFKSPPPPRALMETWENIL
jgi:hypothetical protein